MSATLSAGVNSVILKLDTPYDTIRTSDIRDDLIKVKVWCSTTAGFTPSDSNKVFDALSLSIVISKLADGTDLIAGTPYYIKYAFISDIDETVYTISSELTATPITSSAQTVDISGYTAFAKNGTTFTPSTASLSAVISGITSPVYAWSITGGTLSSTNTASTAVTPDSSATSVSVTLSVTGTGLTTPITKTIVMAVIASGTAGDSIAIVFRRSATQPSTPTASPGTPTAPDTWYSSTNTVPSSIDPIWASTGTKVAGATNYTWQTPVRIEGTVGADGNSISIVFRRSALQPNTPTASASTPTAPDTWYASTGSVPTSTNPMWSSVGTKLSGQTTYTWQLPVRVEGDKGVAGDSARIAYKTQSQTITAAATAATVSATPTSGSTSLPGTGWVATATLPIAGESLWAVDGIYNTTTDKVTWGTPYLTQGFPTTIQSDNYNATTTGWQIQRDTGNAFFNNVTARGSLITGTAGQQRIEINVANSNRIEAFRSDNVRFLSLGGSGGTTIDTAVIGISANANVINPVIVESSATTGSGIHSNTLSTANAISSVSTGGGRLFYGNVTSGSNPDAAVRIDIDSAGHNGAGIKMLMGSSTGPAFYAGGSGDAYAFDGVTGSFGTGKSGVGFFKAIDLPTNTSTITTAGTAAQLVFDGTGLNLTALGPLTFAITLEGTLYQTILEYDPEILYNINQWAIALQASIDTNWRVTSTGTLTSNPIFKITKTTIGTVTNTSGTVTINSTPYAAGFSNGSNNVYSSGYKVIRLNPFPDDSTRVLRGDGTWGTVAGSGGYIDRRYNVRDYGAKGDSLTDDTSAIQSAIDAAKTTGGTVYFPRGLYLISSSLIYTSISADPGARVHFAGDGVGASAIKQTGTGNGLTISGYTGTPLNPNVYTHITDLSFIGSTSGQGVAINDGAYAYIEACQFTGWAYGFYGSDFLASTFVSCQFRFNQRGFLFERIGGTYSSSPNAVTMINCEVGANSLYGGWVIGPGVFTLQGGAIEGNGTTNGSSSSWGLRISEPSGSTSIESAVGISIDGVYFEANIGTADLWITSSSTKLGVTNNINGCSFVRIGSSYVTNNILLDSTAGNGFNNFISGCGFKSLGGYSVSASRKTIVNSNNKVQLLGCSFDNVIDAYVTSDDNVFEYSIRVPGLKDLNGNNYLNAATQYQIPFYSQSGTNSSLSGSTYLTYEDSALYVNKAGVTDLRLAYNLPGVTAPGMSSKGSAIAIASGFNNTTGSYTAGVLVSNVTDSAPSFSGNASSGTKMNLGTSVATWDKFYWGSVTTGITAPSGSTTTFLRNDGTWATPVNNNGTVNTGSINRIPFYASAGNTLSQTSLLTYEDSSLYSNKGGITDVRLTHNLPGVTSPGMSSTGSAIAIASGFNNSTGSYTAGVLITSLVNSSASFSGSVSGTASGTAIMNLGTSDAPWKSFYWGTSSTGIPAPSGSTTTFLRNDGTWATPVNNNGTVNTGSINRIPFYASAGNTLSQTSLLTYEDSSLYSNKGSITDVRLTHNLPGIVAPGISSTGSAIAIASGFNNSTGSYTAGVMVTSLVNSSASFSGSVSGTASGTAVMNLGTSDAPWKSFYWGNSSTGIPAPSGSTTTFLRNDGTWATPASSSGITSITGTSPISASTVSNATTISISAATTTSAGSMSATDKTKLDGIASGATANTGTVTSISTGTGLSGGTITTSGTISLANTAVTAGSYTNASITVDAQGRLTTASSGTAPVTSVSGSGSIVSSGGTTPTISISAATTSAAGSMSASDKTKLDGIASGATVNTGNVNNSSQYQLAYFSSAGTTVSGSDMFTVDSSNDSLYVNKAGATHLRMGYTLGSTLTPPGVSTNSNGIAIATGFTGTTYTAGIYITNSLDSAPSFSGNASSTATKMNLGTSTAQWGKFYWGSVTSGIAPPAGGTTTYLRNDGTWATPPVGVTSVGGTGSGLGFSLSGTVTSTGNLTLTAPDAATLRTNLSLSTVATTGSYNDLSSKPTLGTLASQSSITLAQLPSGATANGQVAYWNGTSWVLGANVFGAFAQFNCNTGSATTTNNIGSILGSTATGITGAYVGTTGSGSTVTLDIRTTSPSDIRLKHEISDTDLGLAFVNRLRPVSYKLKADPKQQKGYGFIADEVEQIIPTGSSLVFEDPDYKVGDEQGFKTIHYPSYVAVLTKAIQELSMKIEALEDKLKRLT